VVRKGKMIEELGNYFQEVHFFIIIIIVVMEIVKSRKVKEKIFLLPL
jgi:hypothetical protein